MTDLQTGRHRLIAECQGLVRFLAQQIHTRMPPGIELDDLIGYGQVGLLQAASDFDPKLGNKFSTFAYYRIRGAIYDGAHQLRWFKGQRTAEAKYDELSDSVTENSSDSAADQGDLAADVGWFQKVSTSLAVVYLSSQETEGRSSDVPDQKAVAPWGAMVQREMSQSLSRAIQQLAPDATQLLRAIYFEDLTLQQAGQRLGISKSWASRMHARALEQLARILQSSGTVER